MLNREKEYLKIKSPRELLEFMDKYINYGIVSSDKIEYTNYENNIHSEFQKACQNKYYLCDKGRMLKYGIGTCWDQVELERAWFTENNYKFKTFYIWFHFNTINNYSTHTYLVYEYNNKYYYFEHADYINKGIYKFNSYKEAIIYQMNNLIKYNKKCGNIINKDTLSHIEVIEYNKPKVGMNQEEFINFICNSKIIYKNNNFIGSVDYE